MLPPQFEASLYRFQIHQVDGSMTSSQYKPNLLSSEVKFLI